MPAYVGTTKKRFHLAIFTLLTLAACVTTLPPLQTTKEAPPEIRRIDEMLKEQQYKEAFQLASTYAKAGNGDAQYRLGFMYHYGAHVDASVLDAAHWYKRAAENGHVDAMFDLASLLALFASPAEKNEWAAIGTRADADAWLKKSAEHGSKRAAILLCETSVTPSMPQALRVEGYAWCNIALDLLTPMQSEIRGNINETIAKANFGSERRREAKEIERQLRFKLRQNNVALQ